MKLYLSSIRIPTPDDLAKLLGKSLQGASVALVPNAQDYYSKRARDFKVGDLVGYMEQLGLEVEAVDLRDYNDAESLKKKLAGHDITWAMGGNTFVLRYEMRRSGFEKIIKELLEAGIVYGGDSAGALAAGLSIGGIELADEPQFAEEVIEDGLELVPFVVLPHLDNPEFADVVPIVRELHQGRNELVELKDSQAVIFDGDKHWIVEAQSDSQAHEKESQSQLSARLTKATEQVTVGGRYMHYKQLNYKVVAVALREEDNEPCVIYQAEYGDNVTWIRPVSSWIEEVEVGGKKVKRFTKL